TCPLCEIRYTSISGLIESIRKPNLRVTLNINTFLQELMGDNLLRRGEVTMNDKIKVLFICQHNSGRSQMAEAFLKEYAGEHFEVESAGMEPAEKVNPLVVEAMSEEGIDLSDKKPRSVFELYKAGRQYSFVVTVCDAEESRCPIFPGIVKRWNVPFEDPSTAHGSRQEQLAFVKRIRDDIKKWIQDPVKGPVALLQPRPEVPLT
ncbi:MAG: arsenate reductase ArsC, partial [Desulfobacteraceae bacterium]